MHYALLHNETPKGVAAARFHIAAGSLQEEDDQRGLAHFIEHMAFNGSQNVPEGEMVKMLERLGLAFGADSNAATSVYGATYRLDLPQADGERLETALFLFREIADKLTLDPAAIDRERGVVLAELRARNTPGARLGDALQAARFPGARLNQRDPIGVAEVLQSAPAEALRRYYETYYRPERALLVLVGDFDVAALEAQIKERFADWRGVRPDAPDPDPGAPRANTLAGAGYFEETLTPSFTAFWHAPPRPAAQTRASTTERLLRDTALGLLGQRLAERAEQADAPFLGGLFTDFNSKDLASGLSMAVTWKGARWREALEETQTLFRQALRYGFLEEEAARLRTNLRQAYEVGLASEATRNTYALAANLVGSFTGRTVFATLAQRRADFEADLARLTPENLHQALRDALPPGEPLLFLAGTKAPSDNFKMLRSQWSQGWKAPLKPYREEAAQVFPYGDFGPPGAIVERGEVADFAFNTYRFANGVRLNVKRTEFQKGRIGVQVNVGGGVFTLKPEPGWPAMAAALFNQGGLGKLTNVQIGKALTGKVASAALGLSGDVFTLNGATTPEFLALELQLLCALLTDPGYRTDAWERLRTSLRLAVDRDQGTPSGVLGRELALVLRNGDRRWAEPGKADIDAFNPAEVKPLFAPALASHPIEIAIVGDVDPEQAVAVVAATFGALPARSGWNTPEEARKVAFPAPGAQHRFTHKGATDQSALVLAWAAPDFANPRRARTAELLANLLRTRILDEVREKQATAYSPSAGNFASSLYPGYGYILISVQLQPEQLKAFEETAARLVEEFQNGAVTPDALERARNPLLERARNARKGNSYWLDLLSEAQSRPETLDDARTRIPDLESITAEDIAALAREVFAKAPVRVEVAPQERPAQPAR